MQHKKPADGKRSARSAGHASASLRRSRRRNRVNWKNVLLILCCVVLPPLGFVLVWRSSWRVTYKYIAFGAMAALMVGALVLSPWPTQNEEGSVTMVQREPEMEIYGPELPDDLVEGYEPRAGESVLAEDPTLSRRENRPLRERIDELFVLHGDTFN